MRKRDRIAVVDDDPMWLTVLGRVLAREGLHTLLVGDPDSALEQIPSERPAVAILDFDLGSSDGAALALELQGVMGAQCPALILVTADLQMLSREQLAPFTAAYEKPVPLERLVAEVRRAIRGRKSSGTILQASAEDIDEEAGEGVGSAGSSG